MIEHEPGFWGNGLRHCVIFGTGSDIAKEIAKRLEKDGWTVSGTNRHSRVAPTERWDLLIVAQGTMEPIGKFFSTDDDAFREAVAVNALEPLSLLRAVWPNRKYGAKVIFIGGPNLAKVTPTYTAYRASKALIASMVETLNVEYPANKFVLFNPGVVKTKIHWQSVAAGSNSANHDRAKAILEGEEPTVSHDEVYTRLMASVGVMPFPENEGT